MVTVGFLGECWRRKHSAQILDLANNSRSQEDNAPRFWIWPINKSEEKVATRFWFRLMTAGQAKMAQQDFGAGKSREVRENLVEILDQTNHSNSELDEGWG